MAESISRRKRRRRRNGGKRGEKVDFYTLLTNKRKRERMDG